MNNIFDKQGDKNGWRKTTERIFLISLTGIWLIIGGCTSVDTIRLTSQTFPSKNSIQELEVLSRTPERAHVAIAELRVEDEAVGFEKMQGAILKKAAKLGADAVVFRRGTKRIVATPAYGGYAYGYRSPGWGFGGFGRANYSYYGYGPGTPMTHDTTVRSLTGIAIRYKDAL